MNTGSLVGLHYETEQPVKIIYRDGIIQEILKISASDFDADPIYLLPGLIDNQVNGYANVDFSGDTLNVEGVEKAAIGLWHTGVTSFLPTLITNSHKNLLNNFSILSNSLSNSNIARSVQGFHLEGPYISPIAGFWGCHPVEHVRLPDLEEFFSYQEAAQGKICQVTLAPELDGAMKMISTLTADGVIMAIGHSNATSSLIAEATDRGLRLSTHLGNGCANMIHRHHNPLWAQMANDKLTPSLIADGHHLLPDELIVFYKVKGPDNLILTSDITFLAGMPAGRYQFGGSEVFLSENGLLRNVDLDCLAGASLPLITGVEHMIRVTGCKLGEAVNMASKNVARIYNWHDRGELLPGKRADILVVKRNNDRINISKTFLCGEEVYTSSSD